MLVITNIFKNKNRIGWYYIHFSYRNIRKNTILNDLKVKDIDSRIKFDILDTTNDKQYNNLDLYDLIELFDSNLKNILGFFELDYSIVLIGVDEFTWKLLDYIKEVKTYSGFKENSDFIKRYYPSYKRVDLDGACSNYKCAFKDGSNYIYLYKMSYEIHKLDEFGLFWYISNYEYHDLGYLFNVFLSDDLRDCKEVIITDDKTYVVLEINKDVMRLITKYKVLRGKI